jgi:hypothetical protein
VALVVVLASSTGTPASVSAGGSIRQLVEPRPQGAGCTGVAIELARLAFNPSIAPDEIEIRDDKYDADLRAVMDWSVSPDGQRLTIRVKTPSTDFGIGNALRVCVERAAFRAGRQPPVDRACWVIGTDPL